MRNEIKIKIPSICLVVEYSDLRNRVSCDLMSGIPQFLNVLIIVVFVADVERGVNGTAVRILTVEKRNRPTVKN